MPLVWRYWGARVVLIMLTVAAAVLMLLPGRAHRDPGLLRSDFTAGLRRYNGVAYDWGGESPKGIDCSGLMRRGLIDGMFLRGIVSGDPGLVRYSIWLWWHDCTAADLGDGRGATTRYFSVNSINTMDPSRLLPGDMAVTTSGAHVMGYLGEGQWIEADPTIGRVIIDTAPSWKNQWFSTPMNIVRWKVLESGAPVDGGDVAR